MQIVLDWRLILVNASAGPTEQQFASEIAAHAPIMPQVCKLFSQLQSVQPSSADPAVQGPSLPSPQAPAESPAEEPSLAQAALPQDPMHTLPVGTQKGSATDESRLQSASCSPVDLQGEPVPAQLETASSADLRLLPDPAQLEAMTKLVKLKPSPLNSKPQALPQVMPQTGSSHSSETDPVEQASVALVQQPHCEVQIQAYAGASADAARQQALALQQAQPSADCSALLSDSSPLISQRASAPADQRAHSSTADDSRAQLSSTAALEPPAVVTASAVLKLKSCLRRAVPCCKPKQSMAEEVEVENVAAPAVQQGMHGTSATQLGSTPLALAAVPCLSLNHPDDSADHDSADAAEEPARCKLHMPCLAKWNACDIASL